MVSTGNLIEYFNANFLVIDMGNLLEAINLLINEYNKNNKIAH